MKSKQQARPLGSEFNVAMKLVAPELEEANRLLSVTKISRSAAVPVASKVPLNEPTLVLTQFPNAAPL